MDSVFVWWQITGGSVAVAPVQVFKNCQIKSPVCCWINLFFHSSYLGNAHLVKPSKKTL